MIKKCSSFIRIIHEGHVLTCSAYLFLFIILSAGNARSESQQVYQNLIIFSEVISEIENNYVDPVESDKMILKAVQGMVRSLDPHSAYLEPEEFSTLEDDTRGAFSGIGVVMAIKDNILTVISPIEDSPAYRAGIEGGDIIVRVNGESTHDMSIAEAVNRIKGKKGTSLTLTILRGEETYLTFELVRDDIPIRSVKAMKLRPGYLYTSITNFNENTTNDLKKALKKFEKLTEPIEGLIIDLRDNPGGLLKQAVDITDMFIDKGDIVSIKGRQQSETQIWKAHENSKQRKYPIVVLINGGSASASEIVAGALQDHKRALILGTTSFGKGTVQNIRKFSDGSAIKLTIARYYTPSGRSIQAEGITPDIELEYHYNKPSFDMKKGALLKEKDLKNHLGKNYVPDDEVLKIINEADSYPDGMVKLSVNMRHKPFKNSVVLNVIKKGETVKIINKVNKQWLKILFKEQVGFIRDKKKFITKRREEDTRDGKLTVKKLMKDNQVKRALELLVSHNIFAHRMN